MRDTPRLPRTMAAPARVRASSPRTGALMPDRVLGLSLRQGLVPWCAGADRSAWFPEVV